MAEEKKKIDLKARLGKGGAAAPTPTPAPVGSSPVPTSAPTPMPGASGPGLPVPPGVPVGPAPAFDPTNPLAAVAAPRAHVHHAMPAQAQRIEVDELAVQQVASRGRRNVVIISLLALAAGVGAGVVVGQAKETGAGRDQARNDAKELKVIVDTQKTKLDDLATKLEAGVKLLTAKEGKAFPHDLTTQLGGIHIDFDGDKLAGRRFAGFPQETSKGLFDFVAGVTALNDHKTAVKNLLTKLDKPISDQFEAAKGGQHSIQYVVLLGGVSAKDNGGNFVANLAQLTPPLSFTGDAPNIPPDMKANYAGQSVSVPKFKGGALTEPSAMYVAPNSFEAVCPSDTKSLVAQLGLKLNDLILEIRGEGKPQGDVITDTKPGLLEQADTLSKGLEKVTAK